MTMTEPVIVEAVRTPFGKRNGALSGMHPAELLGAAQVELIKRTGLDPTEVEQIFGGCVTQAGEQSFNIARTAWLNQGLPHEVAATTIDCQCGSSQQANHLVAGLIGSGVMDVGIGCGVEAMSRVGLGLNVVNGPGRPFPAGFPLDIPDQFSSAERIAEKYSVTRSDADAFGLASQHKAAQAWDEGRFEREVFAVEAPIMGPEGPTGDLQVVERDQGLRDTTEAGLAALKPVLPDDIHRTAAAPSEICDEVPAVWMPSGSTGLSAARPASVVSRRP
jgi:acetyl-CoA C-acetyltransferase